MARKKLHCQHLSPAGSQPSAPGEGRTQKQALAPPSPTKASCVQTQEHLLQELMREMRKRLSRRGDLLRNSGQGGICSGNIDHVAHPPILGGLMQRRKLLSRWSFSSHLWTELPDRQLRTGHIWSPSCILSTCPQTYLPSLTSGLLSTRPYDPCSLSFCSFQAVCSTAPVQAVAVVPGQPTSHLLQQKE